jgi:hypothetical protein
MDLEIISYTIDIKPLKPLPLKNIYCSSCKNIFTSNLKMNAEFYKTCSLCRHNKNKTNNY